VIRIKDMMIYFVENTFSLIYKGKVISTTLKNAIHKGYITDKTDFMEEFLKVIKREKIRSKLFGDEITIVKNAYYRTSDLFYLESIFSELGFVKVHFFDILELLPEEDATYIEVNSSYMVLYFADGVYLDLNYFCDIPRILDYFSRQFKSSLILFGVNPNIPKIKVKNKEVYYFEGFSNYITQSLLKVKKYDA